MKSENNKGIQIQFPNLLLIPLIAIVGAIIKYFGGTSMEYYQIIVVMPFVIYVFWTCFMMGMTFLGYMLGSLINDAKDKD